MNRHNIAVIGTGYWGKNLVRNFNNLDALHTICDTNTETLKTFVQQYPLVRGVSSFGEILTSKEIQGVAISTPAETHFELAREALLAGKDVYIEKPLCLSEQDGRELNKFAEQNKRVLMVGHLLWYHPVVLELKKMIHAGELGRIQYIYSNRLNLGKLRREENVLWSFAPHDISVILGLLEEMPEFVQAQGGNYLHQQIADTTVTLLDFPSGVKAHIFVSWLHPFKEQKLVVVGEKGMAVFDDTAPWSGKLMVYPHSVEWNDNIPVANRAEGRSVTVIEEEPLRAECNHFLQCIENRQRPRTDGEEGLRVLKILNRCQEALEKRCRVCVDKKEKISGSDFFIHPTAEVDEGVSLGSGTKVWHFSHLLAGARIGNNCSLGQNVVISQNVIIGDGCKIQNNVSVYEGVVLEDNVFCGPSMVFTNVINPRCEFPRKDAYKPTLVKRGASLGANSTVVCGHTIGEYAFIGAGAVVTTDVPNFALMVGNPGRQVGWISRYGKRLELPLDGDGEFVCPYTGECYQLCDGVVTVAATV
ncbi:MAG: Gfo/Idh/MocA family oxidoreductase [Proteobacteria bacterium]|nr:Gfo/Idh/MocA family oxidoreductase [Pseudomonadota bacterium]